MKYLPFGYRWTYYLLFYAAFSGLWILFFRYIHWGDNIFSDAIPGFRATVSNVGIVAVSTFVTIKITPVLSNWVGRWLGFTPIYFSAALFTASAYLSFKIITGNATELISFINATQLSLNAVGALIRQNKFDFYWLLTTRIAIPFCIATFPLWRFELANKIKSTKWYKQLYIEGKGASAAWAGTITYKKSKLDLNKAGNGIVLGRALFDDDPHRRMVQLQNDGHMLTCALTGSGKFTTILASNIVVHNGHVICNDPKGELCKATYRARCSKKWLEDRNIPSKTTKHRENGRCYNLDPFSETDLPRDCYNPLSEIDIKDPRVRELLSAISDGCVLPEDKDNSHWVEMAQFTLEGVLAHVLNSHPKENHNLAYVLDLFYNIDPELGFADPTKFQDLLLAMLKDNAAGGLPQQAASKLFEMGDREKGSVLSTLARSLKWVGDPSMRKHVANSSFKFSEINDATTTIYIVLPDGMMNSQTRFLRTLLSLSVRIIMSKTKRPEISTLVVIDEMARLNGQVKSLSDGFALYRGYGLKLWGVYQNIGQIYSQNPQTWGSIIANSNVQVFGVHDLQTANFVSDTLGERTYKEVVRNGKKKSVHEYTAKMLTPNEVMAKLGKATNRQIVFPVDGYPMRLERCSYKPLKVEGKRFRELNPRAFKGYFEDY